MIRNYGVDHYSKTNKFRKESSTRMCLDNPYSKIQFTFNKFKSTDLSYQSSYEYEFLELCEKLNVLHFLLWP